MLSHNCQTNDKTASLNKVPLDKVHGTSEVKSVSEVKYKIYVLPVSQFTSVYYPVYNVELTLQVLASIFGTNN